MDDYDKVTKQYEAVALEIVDHLEAQPKLPSGIIGFGLLMASASFFMSSFGYSKEQGHMLASKGAIRKASLAAAQAFEKSFRESLAQQAERN